MFGYWFTAICVSIDRFLQNTATICCLCFDRIGARHPGIGALARPYSGLVQVGNSVLSFNSRSAGSSTLVIHVTDFSFQEVVVRGTQPQFVVRLSTMLGPTFRHDARCRSQCPGLDTTHSRGPITTRGGWQHILNTTATPNDHADQKARRKTGLSTRRAHYTSKQMPGCRGAGLQYDQNINNKLELYSVGNGLSKRK